MIRFIWLFLTVLAFQFAGAQTRYIIKFKNKATSPYSFSAPLDYLSQRAIDRRTRYSIAIDSADLPVTPRYIDSVRLAGTVTILNRSKWFNSVSIQTTDAAALTKINGFPFVQSVSPIASRSFVSDLSEKFRTLDQTEILKQNELLADYYNYGMSYGQKRLHNGEFLHNIGLRGDNIVIGMFDGGFQSYLTLKAFDSVRINGQILGTWDFVAREESVNEDHPHGMQCFSIIAGNVPGELVGTAPRSKYYLYRSEDGASEYPIEEHNWVCAAERLDSSGGDMISSSLGYADGMGDPSFNHTYAEMNGNTTIAAIGADIAAKKGILVVNAAGNEGDGSWRYIISPADADSVLAVGAVNSSGAVGSFSSYGPSSDGQVKPDVASVGVGTWLWNTSNAAGQGSGTSYACPNMAGLTACLWQGFPEYNNMKIIQTLREASSNFTLPNDRIGYGVPDMKKAVMNLLKELATSSASISNCKATLVWNSKDMGAMKYEIERMLQGQSSFTKIGEQQGTGSVFGTRNNLQYEDVLTNVNAGTVSYRIRQIIDTAAASLTAVYIDTTMTTLATGCTPTGVDPVITDADGVSIIPNPARDQFKLRITSTNAIPNLQIRIVNTKGQEVAVHKKSKTSGTINIDISVMSLAKGKYYVMLYNDGKLMTTKELIKL